MAIPGFPWGPGFPRFFLHLHVSGKQQNEMLYLPKEKPCQQKFISPGATY